MSDEEYKDYLVLSPNEVFPNFYNVHRRRFGNCRSAGGPTIPYSQLSVKQKKIYELVERHISKPVEAQLAEPLRIIITGQAGNF